MTMMSSSNLLLLSAYKLFIILYTPGPYAIPSIYS